MSEQQKGNLGRNSAACMQKNKCTVIMSKKLNKSLHSHWNPEKKLQDEERTNLIDSKCNFSPLL